jgi:hypothetical protein
MTFSLRRASVGFKIAHWTFPLLLIVSCASPVSQAETTPLSPPRADPVFSAGFPTPTPFQPEDSPDPYLADSTPQPAPTFTPYPTKYVVSQGASGTVEVVPPENVPAVNNPLTGQPVSDPALLQRRPLAIKIGNSPDYVRPQSGLTLADVVYEYYIEWGDTRFIAVFYGNNPERVGPVRSGRYFDEHVARMYHAFLFFKGADPRELNYLKDTDIREFLIIAGIGSCPPYFVGPYRRDAYNNVFFNPSKWDACAERKGLDNSPQTISGGFFADEAPESPLNVSRIEIFYSVYNYNYWEYDPAAHRYLRYQEAYDLTAGRGEAYAPLTDDLTKLPVTAENVAVLFVPYIYANTYNAEDEVFHVDLIDYGNAYVFRDGIAIPARWNRAERDQPILLTALNGDPIYLRPGRTFYQVIGATSPYSQSGTTWRFVFQTP